MEISEGVVFFHVLKGEMSVLQFSNSPATRHAVAARERV